MANRFSVEAVFKAVDRMTAPVSRMQNRVGKMTRSMEKGLRRLNARFDKISGAIGRGVGRIARFGGAVAAALGGATIIALNRTADAADALAKQSRRLQFPIAELQEWKFVAEQSGVSTELLDKSLGAFSKRLGEAKGGTGPLVTGLKNINPLLLEQLQNTDSVAGAFEIYVGAMRNAESATERAALANAAFSRAGLELANIADNSAAAIEALRIEQRENGNITMAQAMAAEAYNDAINSLKKSLTGLMQGVLLPLMPVITKQVREWRDWIAANRELLQVRIIEFLTRVKDRMIGFYNSVVKFNQEYDLGDRLLSGIDSLGKLAKWLGDNGQLVLNITVGIVALSAALKIFTGIMIAVNLAMTANPIGLVVAGVVALGAAAAVLIAKWEPIKAFFKNLWADVMGIFDSALDRITGVVDTVAGIGEFLGIGGERRDVDARGRPQVVSPQDRTAQSISETRSTESSEVTIRDETGRAEVTKKPVGRGNINLQQTGAF